MNRKNNQKINRFANFGGFFTDRKSAPSPPTHVEKTRTHAASVWSGAGANRGFGAGENDWLGAEAYVNSLL